MNTYETDPHVGGGSQDEKPARIALRTGETIDAVHHFITKDGWVAVYETERSGGIDFRFPPSAVKWIDTRNATVTDDSDTVEPGDRVEYAGQPWTVTGFRGDYVELDAKHQSPREAPIDEVTPRGEV